MTAWMVKGHSKKTTKLEICIEMELSTEVHEGLQLAGDAAHVPDKTYPVLLKKVFRDIFVRPDAQITEGKL